MLKARRNPDFKPHRNEVAGLTQNIRQDAFLPQNERLAESERGAQNLSKTRGPSPIPPTHAWPTWLKPTAGRELTFFLTTA